MISRFINFVWRTISGRVLDNYLYILSIFLLVVHVAIVTIMVKLLMNPTEKNISITFFKILCVIASDLMKAGRGQKHPIRKIADSRVVLLRSKYKSYCF